MCLLPFAAQIKHAAIAVERPPALEDAVSFCVCGVVSPVLANLYLHYALDLWVERSVKPRCRGEVLLYRYADDFVCAFRFETDARRCFSTGKAFHG